MADVCQCGCGDYAGRWRIPGPDGKWYVIAPYQGCRDCSNPPGLFIDLMDDLDMKDWEAHKLPIVGGPDHPNFGIPTVDTDVLTAALFKALDDAGVNVGEDEIAREETIEEMDMHRLIGGVVWDSAEKWDKERRKGEKRRKQAEREAKAAAPKLPGIN